MRRALWISAVLVTGAASLNAATFSPMRADKALVAGSSDKGYRDGEFWNASFDGPAGMALSEDGSRLFVGDPGNRAIRVVAMGPNIVSTFLKLKAPVPADASEVAVLGGGVFFVPSDGKGLWRVDAAHLQPVCLAGSSVTADSAGAPVAISTQARVYWLGRTGDGSMVLNSCGADGLSLTASAPIPALGKGILPHIVYLDGFFFAFNSALGETARLDLPGGYASLAAPSVVPAMVSPSAVSMSLAGLGSPAAWTDHSGFLGWNEAKGSLQLAYPGGGTRSIPLYDKVGGLISDPGTPLLAGATPPRVYKVLSTRTHSLYDPFRKTVLFSDQTWNRIMGLSTIYLMNDENHWNFSYYYSGADPAEPKETDVIRLVAVCNSLFVVMSDFGDRGPMKGSVWKQFELYLNMENALAGTGRRYEVPAKGNNLSDTKGVFAYTINQQHEFDRLRADELLVCVDYRALVKEITTLTENAQADDLVAVDQDPEWALKSASDRKKGIGPLTEEWYKLVKESPGNLKESFWIDDQGKVAWKQIEPDPQLLMGNPRFRDFLLRYSDKMLGKLEKANLGHRKIHFLIMPFASAWSGEIQSSVYGSSGPLPDETIDEALARLIRAHGFSAVDMIPACRAVGFSFEPFFGENFHYISQAHPWIGQMAARLFFEDEQAAAGAP